MKALQATLAAEHAAVHVYAVLGGRLSRTDNPAVVEVLEAAYDVHLARRDELRSDLADLGATPVPAAPAYAVDAEDRSAAHLLSVARVTEERCAVVYAQLVGASSGARRRWAVEALTDSAVRLLDFGGAPSAYPGLPELRPSAGPVSG